MSGKQPPFNFVDEYGDFRGIDVNIMRAVGEIEGFNVEFQKEPYAEIFQTIDNGENDGLFGGLAYNEERAVKYAVSNSYLFVLSAIMYVKKNNSINDISDIEGLRYAGVPVTLQTKYFLETYPNNEYVKTDSTFLAFEKLIRGEVDFIAEDLQFLNYLKLRYPEYDLAITNYQTKDDLTSQQIALARKDNAHLIDKINNGFEVMQSKGEIERV